MSDCIALGLILISNALYNYVNELLDIHVLRVVYLIYHDDCFQISGFIVEGIEVLSIGKRWSNVYLSSSHLLSITAS